MAANDLIGNPYLTFSSPSSFTLNVVDNIKYWDGTLEYSTNTTTWNTWAGTSAISSASDGTKHNLYLRGTGNTYITGSSASASPSGTVTKAKWVLTGNSISCDGNIEYLLDYNTVLQGSHPTMANNCYKTMFSDCTSLTIAPSLPATTLTAECYSFMFNGCTSLTTAPNLPATTLTRMCYYNMFRDCTSLTTAPSLPATTLKNSCYYEMFYRCISLTTVPSLPATTLSTSCYQRMFYSCYKIKLSTTQTEEYQTAYRIPTSGTGTDGTNSLVDMFVNTGGTFTGTPAINTTYYLYQEPQTASSIYIGSSPIQKCYVGNNEVQKIYIGDKLVYEKQAPGPVMPAKGDLINVDMTGSGTPQQFRVLKINGSLAEILSMSNATSKAFDSGGYTNTYNGKTLDSYLNMTWYDTLSTTAKTAIIDKIFRQDSWYWGTSGDPDFQGKSSEVGGYPYQISLGNASYGIEITRHAYAISVQDVLDYLEVTPQMTQANTTLTYTNIWKMFWNDSVAHSNQYIWLRSALASIATEAFFVNGDYGFLNYYTTDHSFAVRPALTIDLSKIDFTIN